MSKIKLFEDYNEENELLKRYYIAAQKYSKQYNKSLSEIKPLETLIGTYNGFDYDGNFIFYEDGIMLIQSKDETNERGIHEISDYEIENL